MMAEAEHSGGQTGTWHTRAPVPSCPVPSRPSRATPAGRTGSAAGAGEPLGKYQKIPASIDHGWQAGQDGGAAGRRRGGPGCRPAWPGVTAVERHTVAPQQLFVWGDTQPPPGASTQRRRWDGSIGVCVTVPGRSGRRTVLAPREGDPDRPPPTVSRRAAQSGASR